MKKIMALLLALVFVSASALTLSGCSGDSGTLKEIPLSDSENPVVGKVGDMGRLQPRTCSSFGPLNAMRFIRPVMASGRLFSGGTILCRSLRSKLPPPGTEYGDYNKPPG